MFARPKRKAATINISELPSAKGSILAECTNMHTSLITIDYDLIRELAESKKQKVKDDDSDNEKYCKAEVFEGDTVSTSGEYDSNASIHAELNALVSYIGLKSDLSNISKIRITSPPCKSCAFVLKLLGLLDKVQTTKQIYKEHTGSWVWPQALQNSQLFYAEQWKWVREQFDKTGIADEEIIPYMVAVIQSKCAF
jgi:deoxycytidylate deaminase